MKNEDDIRATARRGEKLLDNRAPGWDNMVDADKIWMDDCLDCILGQVFGTFEDGIEHLGLSMDNEGSYYGFYVSFITEDGNRLSSGSICRRYAILRNEWLHILRDRAC